VNAVGVEPSRHRPLLAIMDDLYPVPTRERSWQSDAERQSEPRSPVWQRPLAIALGVAIAAAIVVAITLQRANAAALLQQTRAQLAVQQANLDQTRANVRVAEADMMQAQKDYDRFTSIDPHAVSRQQVDNATATFRSAQAKLDAARQVVGGAEAQLQAGAAQVEAAQTQVKEADANVAAAELQLSYCTIVAPVAGRIGHRTVSVGNYVNPGQALFAIMQDDMWVTANFKETQLAAMHPGQPVDIDIDAIPSVTFHGHVDSFQPGTGSEFSVLPAENATGNYVKIVQRLPVKIVFDDDRLKDYRISPGLSVVPTVRVR
jgi:membrane fusion protein, multidrug efflux system